MIQRSWTAFEVALTGTIATLLLCFFVATPMCTLGMVQSPVITSGGIVHLQDTDLLINVNREGVWYSEADPARPYRRIVIRADRRTHYGALLPVFRAARARGLPIVLISDEVSVLELHGIMSRTKR